MCAGSQGGVESETAHTSHRRRPWLDFCGCANARGYACACTQVLEIMERDQIVEGVASTLAPAFQSRLAGLASHPLVGEVSI